MSILDELNERQRAAASWPGGPMLVLAGAGSGKTRVLTHRIAHLLERGVPAERILAVTFTNKAAAEMRDRVLALVERGAADATAAARPEAPWLGTFHAACLRLLRREVDRTELAPGFVIYDQDDSRALVKACLRELGHDDKVHPPRRIAARISRLKAACRGPDAVGDSPGDPVGRVVGEVYPQYQRKLLEANACDFDDLLMRAVLLLEADADVRDRVQERTEHLLVDEYQDTNAIQYRLIRLLCGRHRNVCVVGDEDQSIYRFRGADVGNILEFERDFPGTEVFRIEQNYRSSAHVLAAANAVVSRNVMRKGKVLWTENDPGDPVRVHEVASGEEEADWIASEITRLAEDGPLSEIAVLYRTNAQSRLFEQALSRRHVPHAVIGATRFFERREVRDVLAYLRLAVNPADDVALERVLNVPPRGIGNVTRELVRGLARDRSVPLWSALARGLEEGAFPARAEAALDRFVSLVETLQREAPDARTPDLLQRILDETAYVRELEKEGADIAQDRAANLDELLNAAAQHDAAFPGAGPVGFLAEIALASDTDDLGQADRVQLMTLHSAKGLEFDTVFVAGLEEDLLPHANSRDEPEALEEERRLCYVGMTRARRRLTLSHARRRFVMGTERVTLPSRFLSELPEDGVERTGGRRLDAAPRTPRRVSEGSASAVASFFGSAAETEEISQESGWEEPEYQYGAPEGTEASPAAPPDGADVPPAPESRPWRRGDLLRHATYGPGRVVGLESVAGRRKLTVYFASRGRVKLMEGFAPIERVD